MVQIMPRSRKSIPDNLTEEEKEAMIFAFASEYGGTEYDLDPLLEQAGLEALAKIYEQEKAELTLSKGRQRNS